MLRHRADRRAILWVASYFTTVALAFCAESAWAIALATLSLCYLSFASAVITHNAVHCRVFHDRRLETLLRGALTAAYGHPVSMFVPGHNLSHHRHLQSPRDRMRTTRLRFRWNLLNQLLFTAVVTPAIVRDNVAYARDARTTRPRWYAQLLRETAVYACWMALGLGVAIAIDGVPWRFLLFVLVPHQYATWGIMGINFVQHDGTDAEHPYDHSRNFTGRVVNWLTFNNGFHGIHHMRPGLHWSLAPAVHARELAPHVDPRLDQRSLLAYCWRAYGWPGRRVRFDGRPVVLAPIETDAPWMSLPSSVRS